MPRPNWIPPGFSWKSGVSVDLGAGRFPRNPLRAQRLIGIDILDYSAFDESEYVEYRKVNPGEALPVGDAEADCCTAYDFLEHVPRFDRLSDGTAVNPFIAVMNEIYRILKPGGVLIAITPCYPREAAFTDPTHVNFITPGTHEYFSGHTHARALGYGFAGDFDCLKVGWLPLGSPFWECVDDGSREQLADPLNEASNSLPGGLARVPLLRRLSRSSPFHFLWLLRRI